MKRDELLKSKEYWITKIQLDLFEMMHEFMKSNNMNQSQLAKKLGVTKGYLSQILNCNFDHKISKLVELALALGKVPHLEFKDLKRFIDEDKFDIKQDRPFNEYSVLIFNNNNEKEQTVVDNQNIIHRFNFNEPQGYSISN